MIHREHISIVCLIVIGLCLGSQAIRHAPLFSHPSTEPAAIQTSNELRQAPSDDSQDRQGVGEYTKSATNKTLRSWQIILSDEELNSTINMEESRDDDFAGGSFDGLIDSLSSHVFKNTLGDAEVFVTEVRVGVYLTEAAAGQYMTWEYATHFEREKNVENNKLKLYPSPDGLDTKTDVNPFYSRKVPIRPFGDESFCFEWTAFAPTVVYRVTNIVVTVTARIDIPSRNRTYHDAATFEQTLDVAKHQEAKIRSLMRSAVFQLPSQQTEADHKLLANIRAKAQKGDAQSQYELGRAFDEGSLGVAKDEAEAVKWYRKAAEQNYTLAQNKLAGCYYKGEGVARDYVEAAKWFRKAAEQNNADAQSNLGACYGLGKGVAENEVEAVKWFRKAAEQNYADAQFNLGSCNFFGEGVVKDYVEAVKWFRKAAEQNHARAQYSLGSCYDLGDGVAKDELEAVKWFRKAAEQNLGSAQNSLGACYLLGEGVAKDNVEAYKWKLLAARQGDEDARKIVTLLEDRMTREQIAEGQKLARNFKPRSVPAADGRVSSFEMPATKQQGDFPK
jgi:TPR repeat protein